MHELSGKDKEEIIDLMKSFSKEDVGIGVTQGDME